MKNQLRKFLLVPAIVFIISTQAQTNNALSFDGIDDYVSVPHNASLNLGNFTFEAWINLTSASGALTILSKGDGSNGAITNYIFNVGANSNNSKLGLFAGGAWYSATTTLSTGIWYHAAVIVSGTAVTFYLNGVSDGTATLSVAMYTGGTYLFKIGEQGDGCNCNHMNGKIDEIRVWNTARTQTEIRTYLFNKNLSNSTAGLVAYYRFNEGSGTSTANSCTNTIGIDGTLTNGTAWQASPVQFSANALNFDGSDDFVIIPYVVSSDFTVEFWMKTTSTGPGGTQWYNGNGIVDAEVGGVTNDWGTSLVSSKLAFGTGNTDITIMSVSSVNTGNWVHVAASWKQSTGAMSLYINGTLEASTTGSTNLRNAPPRITFGELQTNINRFNGSLDEVRIWNQVRSLAQVQADKDKEVDPSVEANLLAYYTFNQGIASGTNTGLSTLMDQKSTNNGTLNNFSLSGSTSNFIAQNSGLIVLPLQWLSFTVQKQDNHVMLNWSTAGEQNTKDFTVQHSVNGRDWNNTATVIAAGNSNSTTNYNYLHLTPVEGINYYRILQRDMDNLYSYSEIRTLKFIHKKLPFTILVDPVVNDVLKVQVNASTTLSLYNNNGALLWKKQLSPGIETFDMHGYAKGIYLLKANDQSEKVIVQ